MKPGMIITNYKTVKESSLSDSINDNSLNSDIFVKEKIEKAKNEYDSIIEKANKESQSIIEKANQLLINIENLKTSIENNYIDYVKNNYILSSQSFLDKKNDEFNNLIDNFNNNFNNITLKAQDDICDILLNTFKSFFNEEYKNPDNIRKIICNNFDNFDSSKNIELTLSNNLYEKFTDEFKVKLEDDLNIQISEIRKNKKLNGFIMNTELGSIECDLDMQIQSLKEQLSIYM